MDWGHIGIMLAFAGVGLLLHIMIKFFKATALSDYVFQTFLRLNWRAWVTGLLWSIVGCYIYHELSSDKGEFGCNFIGFLIGFSGGALGKDIFNGIIAIISKNLFKGILSFFKTKKL